MQNKDFKYIEKGEKGRTCAECKYYEASTTDTIGKCFGYAVHPAGSCDLFERRRGEEKDPRDVNRTDSGEGKDGKQ